jgi:hypothetical protein
LTSSAIEVPGLSPTTALRIANKNCDVGIGDRDFADYCATRIYLNYFGQNTPIYIKTNIWKGINTSLNLDLIEKLKDAIKGTLLYRRDRTASRLYICSLDLNLSNITSVEPIRAVVSILIIKAQDVTVTFYTNNIHSTEKYFTDVLLPNLNSLIEPYTSQPEDEHTVSMSFSIASMGGANISSRRIQCPTWDEIKTNYPYSHEEIDKLFSMDDPDRYGKFIFWHGNAGTGKCQKIGTPILKFNGEVVPIETIKIGDLLMGPDSKPRKVLSTTKGFGKMYKVTPTKGDPYTVNDKHVLSLKYSGTENIINIPIEEYLQDIGTSRFQLKGWRTGVDWNKQEVPLPPYILGLWLGDGNNNTPIIHTADQEVITELERFVASIGLELSKYSKKNNSATVCRIISSHTKSINPFLENLRSLNVMGNKHIPLKYRANDKQTRLELLAGLIDSDGHLGCGGYEILTKYPKLRDDILFVARSLGFAAYSKEKESYCQTGGGGIYHRIFISGDTSKIPVRIKRKKAAPRKQIKDVLKTGISVDYANDAEYFGFELDGDSLYLLGDFTVTHNSFLIRAALQRWKMHVRCMYIVDPENFFNNASYMQEVLLHRPSDADNSYAWCDDEWYDEESHVSHEGSKFRLLIIEDGLNNMLTETRYIKEGAVSRFLNLTDGILGQGLRLVFIVTSNEQVTAIDHAFLRKGRCLQELEFPEFDEATARKWLESKNKKLTFPLKNLQKYSLADLYSYINNNTCEISKKSDDKRLGFL